MLLDSRGNCGNVGIAASFLRDFILVFKKCILLRCELIRLLLCAKLGCFEISIDVIVVFFDSVLNVKI